MSSFERFVNWTLFIAISRIYKACHQFSLKKKKIEQIKALAWNLRPKCLLFMNSIGLAYLKPLLTSTGVCVRKPVNSLMVVVLETPHLPQD